MTVIVYRDGIMAADRQSTISGVRACEITKIARRESDGALIGVAGDAGLASAYMRWFVAGEPEPRPSLHVSADEHKTALAIIVRPGGGMEEHSVGGWAKIEGPFFAYGSGLEAAIAAMHMGADAMRAVEIANIVTTGCGMGIDVVRLGTGFLAKADAALQCAAANARENGPTDGRFTVVRERTE